MTSQRLQRIFEKLAEAERGFMQQEFLAPVVEGGVVQVRIAGVINRLKVTPRSFRGFGVFRSTSASEAILVREASLAQRRQYLALLPASRFILFREVKGQWFGTAAHQGDARFFVEGVVPLKLCAEVQLFDVVRARFDGRNFWFEAVDPSHDFARSRYLREQLALNTAPNLLSRSGLTLEERTAYESHFAKDEDRTAERDGSIENDGSEFADGDARWRLRKALSHAGADLIDLMERSDGFRVRYRVDGQMHTSSVNKNDLSVQVAGICLSGEDHKFDLASLVGVLREANVGVLRIGDDGIDEETYWDIHPRNDSV
jgi:hypothetical protein